MKRLPFDHVQIIADLLSQGIRQIDSQDHRLTVGFQQQSACRELEMVENMGFRNQAGDRH